MKALEWQERQSPRGSRASTPRIAPKEAIGAYNCFRSKEKAQDKGLISKVGPTDKKTASAITETASILFARYLKVIG